MLQWLLVTAFEDSSGWSRFFLILHVSVVGWSEVLRGAADGTTVLAWGVATVGERAPVVFGDTDVETPVGSGEFDTLDLFLGIFGCLHIFIVNEGNLLPNKQGTKRGIS